MDLSEPTIAAISTPIGEGGLAVIRLSGTQALSIADQIFQPLGKGASLPSAVASHTLHFGKIMRENRVIDEVILSVMKAPRSFTREDVVEISCHGGLLIARRVLDLVLQKGARLAEPGEFSRRAFLNGRIDLTQAEAICDLIQSRTDLALQAANEQLAGKLSQRIHLVRDDLMKVLAHIEAHIDFPDEDISPATREQLISRHEAALKFIDELLRTAPEGRILRKGIRAVIVGRPNSGKSSLLNALLGHDRAIVSPIAGTTRDTIEETANIRGIPVVFIDTAGLRAAGDEIEAEGIRRSHRSLEQAELILHVVDQQEKLHPTDLDYLKQKPRGKRLLVRNKIDLERRFEKPKDVDLTEVGVSCQNGEGIEGLKDAIKNLVWTGGVGSESWEVMINARHEEALQRARTSLVTSLEALRTELSFDLVAVDLRAAVGAIGEIVGKTTTEDLLDAIFSQFCLGK